MHACLGLTRFLRQRMGIPCVPLYRACIALTLAVPTRRRYDHPLSEPSCFV